MKILFCTNAFENITNGPAKFANLILEINERHAGHEIRILTEDVSHERQYVYKVNLRIPRLLKPLGQLLRMFVYYRKTKQIQREYAYDVIVYNNAFTGLWASLVSGQPTVGMINDEKNLRATLAGFKFSRQWLKQFAFSRLEYISTRTHRLIITNSDFLREKVMQTYRVPAVKTHRLYKSIDLPGIVWQPDRNFQPPIQVVFVKADYRVGNLPVLAEALSQLSGYGFVLHVIGPDLKFETDVKRYFTDKPNVELRYWGPQPQAVVYQYLRAADIFCVPSATEALGVANIEALAHGIPVVSSRVGGIPEVLDNGNNGWLAEPGNAVALAAAIGECIRDAEARCHKSARGRDFIAVFDKKEMLSDFLIMLKYAADRH